MSTRLDAAPISTPSEATPGSEVRTRYGRAVRPPVRYEPIEQVEDDYETDDYDEDVESDVSSAVEFSESEIEAEEDDSDIDDFIVPDKNESDEDDNGSGTDSSGRVRAPVAGARSGTPAARKVPTTKVPVRGKN